MGDVNSTKYKPRVVDRLQAEEELKEGLNATEVAFLPTAQPRVGEEAFGPQVWHGFETPLLQNCCI